MKKQKKSKSLSFKDMTNKQLAKLTKDLNESVCESESVDIRNLMNWCNATDELKFRGYLVDIKDDKFKLVKITPLTINQ